MKKISTKAVTKIGILSSIIIILSISPIGFIPIGSIRITTIHIPIILISLIEKPKISFFVGLFFGLFSFFQHLSGISPLSFIFINPIVSVFPRALIGVITYYTFKLTKKHIKNIFNLIIPSIIGTMVNTLGVIFMAYIFCSKQIYEVLKIDPIKFLFTIAITNGIFEIIICSILVPIIYKNLQKIIKKNP